jgi:hypothetical protein
VFKGIHREERGERGVMGRKISKRVLAPPRTYPSMSPSGVLADSEMLQCIPGHRCGDRTYNTLEQCCDNDTILPLTWTQLCGIYWACFELCHPEPFGSQKEFAVREKFQV